MRTFWFRNQSLCHHLRKPRRMDIWLAEHRSWALLTRSDRVAMRQSFVQLPVQPLASWVHHFDRQHRHNHRLSIFVLGKTHHLQGIPTLSIYIVCSKILIFSYSVTNYNTKLTIEFCYGTVPSEPYSLYFTACFLGTRLSTNHRC